MISKIIINFSNYFILNSKDYLVSQNFIEDFANNKSIYEAEIYRDIGVFEKDLSTSTK